VDAAAILDACSSMDLPGGDPYFAGSFAGASLLLVEHGFVVIRRTESELHRSVITCEAGAGRVVLPPARDEILLALGSSRIKALSDEAVAALLALPSAAELLLRHLASTLAQKQDAIGNFAHTRHIDRVQQKLLQLARNYGRVVRDGIRIDFPLSHNLLAEMIGSSRETVTRALDELQRRGFVARRGHTYRLLVAPEAVLSTDSI
jgi:CRP-like cAMP-binding protein